MKLLYIFWFLHQTTTYTILSNKLRGCISFDSYIKPQHAVMREPWRESCISFDSYIKPQPTDYLSVQRDVVYLLIPTSNHNLSIAQHSTMKLYIFWFLHQTTTVPCVDILAPSCISFDSYIKPQLLDAWNVERHVVYLLIPTSNHNQQCTLTACSWLYIFWFLHQTTTRDYGWKQGYSCISFDSYIKPQPGG